MVGILLAFSVALTPTEVLQKVDSVATVPHSVGILEETIVTTSGSKRTFRIKYFTKDNMDKQLMVYLYPEPVAGTSFLIVGDNVWAYFPETGRTRKIASHARRGKVMGSDFTYEDLSTTTYGKKFKPVSMKTTENAYILELVPRKNTHISYSKIVMTVDKSTFVPTKIDFYRKDDGKPYKTLYQSDIEVIDGIPTPKTITMVNNLTGGKTVMKIVSIDYKSPIEDRFFTLEGMRGALEK